MHKADLRRPFRTFSKASEAELHLRLSEYVVAGFWGINIKGAEGTGSLGASLAC